MSANFRNPNFLLPNELNRKLPASGAEKGSGLTEDRHSLYSMEFDGANDIITVNTSTGVDFSNPFTISLWAKWTAADIIDNTAGIIQLAKESQSYSFMIGTGVGSSNNTFSVSWNNNNYEFGGSYGDGNWHNIIVTGNGVNWSGVKVYIDGANVTGSASSTSALGVNSTVTYIGQNTYGGNRQFKGLIDEVAIWSSDQSNNVSNIHNGGSPANIMALSNKPTAYYPLGEQARDNTEWQFPNEVLQSHVFDFDSTSPGDYINIGVPNFLSATSTFTSSLWFNTDDVNSQTTLWMVGSSASQLWGLSKFQDDLIIYGGSSTKYYRKNTLFNINTWYNLIVVYDGSQYHADRYKAYLDGVLLTSPTIYGTIDTTTPTFTNDFNIGRIDYAAASYFNGKISNVAIWNSDQSANIANIYNYGTPQSSYTVTPTAWYKLNAATSSYNFSTSTWTITDSAGSSNGTSTTLPSTALVSSDLQFESPYSNFSLNFDGAKYIIIGSSTVLDNVPSNPYSFSFWFKSSTAGSVLSEKRAANNFVNAQYAIHLESGYIKWYGGADGATGTQTSNTLVDNQWHHIVCVAESTTVNKIYVDGQLDVTSNANRINGLVVAGTFNIGANYGGSYRFNGNLDETAIFSKALTQAEVSQVYNNGYAADLTSLSPVSWWRLGEDAYFLNNLITIPNQISGAPNGTGSGTMTSTLVADAPGSYASGVGTNLADTDRKGEAPESTANSQSINMIPGDVHPYPPGYVPAQVNNIASMSFDGINDYFDAGNPIELQFTGAFSVSFWMKGNLASAGNRAMVSKDNNASNPRAFSIERTNAYPGGYFVVYNGTSAYGVYVASSDANYINIGDNNWHNVVGVYTPSASVALFVDGTFVKSNTTSIPSSVNFVNDNLNIGRRSQGVNYFPGDIDEVAVFNYALSPKQIKEDIYNASTTGKTADLNNNSNLTAPVAWYRMGD